MRPVSRTIIYFKIRNMGSAAKGRSMVEHSTGNRVGERSLISYI